MQRTLFHQMHIIEQEIWLWRVSRNDIEKTWAQGDCIALIEQGGFPLIWE